MITQAPDEYVPLNQGTSLPPYSPDARPNEASIPSGIHPIHIRPMGIIPNQTARQHIPVSRRRAPLPYSSDPGPSQTSRAHSSGMQQVRDTTSRAQPLHTPPNQEGRPPAYTPNREPLRRTAIGPENVHQGRVPSIRLANSHQPSSRGTPPPMLPSGSRSTTHDKNSRG